MNRFRFQVIMGVLLFCSCNQASEPTQTHSIVGYAVLVDSITGSVNWQADMRGTAVSIEGTTFSTISDSTGFFRFDNVPDGDHVFDFTHEGYGFQRSTKNNTTYQLPTESATHIFFTATLFPLSSLTIAMDSVYFDDSIYFVGGHWENVTIGPNGDTIDRGTFVGGSQEVGKILKVAGHFTTITSSDHYSKAAIIFFGKSPTISTDTTTWFLVAGIHPGEIEYVDNRFTLRFYSQQLNNLQQRSILRSGEKIYCVAYAIPSYENTTADGQGTLFPGAYRNEFSENTRQYTFSTIGTYPSEVKSFVMF